ncbi:MAG TPA: right-handed parallel beta-helix repeat-containing protein [Thermoanaerobaculia bacterium]
MGSIVRWMVALSAVLVAMTASAQRSLVVAGGVYYDRGALATRTNFAPLPGVTVKLYRDSGNRTPASTDTLVATAATDASGVYVFTLDRAGEYWVAVDSRSISPMGSWAEQTFGPAGALCVQPDGSFRTNWFEGACFGGRSLASDDASLLETSEHLALVTLREPATRVDFGFSFDVVTSVEDGEAIQGSLRQFIVNSNLVTGPNHMRFVPLVRADERRSTTFVQPPRWWTIALQSPLPPLEDDETVIDGTAYNFLSPSSVMDIHPGRIGEAPTVQSDETLVPRLEKPELEILLSASGGIVCKARCGVRAVALHGARRAVAAQSDLRIEHVLIGASPDGLPADASGEIGVEITEGTAVLRHVLVTQQTRAGVFAASGARIAADYLDVTASGTFGDPDAGAAIVLLSEGSSLRSSSITANRGAGLLLGSLDGNSPANANTIDGNLISGNRAGVVLGPGSSRNVITRNDLMWNQLGGVTIAEHDNLPPRENRLSANRYNENGLRPIVLDLGVERPNDLARAIERCERVAALPNGGIAPPRLTSIRLVGRGEQAGVVLEGVACPGEIVELYQSFVTSGIRERVAEMPKIRGDGGAEETLGSQERVLALPSIGEFNYLGAAHAGSDGRFEATYPVPVISRTSGQRDTIEETNVWASEVLRSAETSVRAYSAIAIDASGNTSEMSVRRRVD